MMFTALAPHCEQMKRRQDAIAGKCNSSDRPSAANVNAVERWQAAFAQVTKKAVEAVGLEMRDGWWCGRH
jgi:hypothetical protein